MTSKKTAASKRAAFPRAADYAKSFYKDWQRLTQSGRYDMKRLKEAYEGQYDGALASKLIKELLA